jgi:hypothetical protein
MATRAAGWDVLSGRLKTRSARALVEGGGRDEGQEGIVDEMIERERALALAPAPGESGDKGGGGERGEGSELRERTRWNVRKALRYRSAEDVKLFGEKVREHMVRPPHHH